MLGYKIDKTEHAKLLLKSLLDSYDQLCLNLMNNILMEYLVFDDVATLVLEEESRWRTKKIGKEVHSKSKR